MTKSEIETILKEAIQICGRMEGWANLAEIGTHLRKQGVKYGKLSRFLEDYKDLVETKVDTTLSPPAVYVKLLPQQS
jgi:OST-HTH/LOTUS domain